MDLVKLFKDFTAAKQAANDGDGACGFCWEFSAPLFESDVNVLQPDNNCCVQIILSEIKEQNRPTYASSTGLVAGVINIYSFKLYAVKSGNMGVNNYNEIKGHPIEESRYAEVYKPIRDCLTGAEVIKFCELLGLQAKLLLWDFTTVNNYQDLNFNGWLIQGSIQIENENF